MCPQISMGFFPKLYSFDTLIKVSIYLSICKINIKFPNFILHSFEKPILPHKICSCVGLPCNGRLPKCSLTRVIAADENALILNDHIKGYRMANSRLFKTARPRFQNSRLQDPKSPETRLWEPPKTLLRFRDRAKIFWDPFLWKTILYPYVTSSFNLAYISCVIYV